MSLLPRTGRLKGLRALQRFDLEKEFKFNKYLTPWRRAELAKHVEIGEELVEAYFTMRRRGNDKSHQNPNGIFFLNSEYPNSI